MGLSLCKPCRPCCRCCRCYPCCRRCEDVPDATPPIPPPPGKENKLGSVFYRSHNMDPNFPLDLLSKIDGKDNDAFTPSDETPPSGGPEPSKGRHSAPHITVYTETPGKRRSLRLEALRTQQVSTHNYKPRSSEDLEVRKGEEVEVLEDRGPWIFAKTLNADGEAQTGFIPRTFLADAGSLEAEEL